MIRNIAELLAEAGLSGLAPDDAALSSGERAYARIAAVLDALDGVQQRSIVDVLERSARASADAEAYARSVLRGAD